ncbi:MAG: hypothetical protein FWD71_02925 [Oscillospiraceae bacterium]|nr:hypothetical protein [Oscillospiraceae bacterium]
MSILKEMAVNYINDLSEDTITALLPLLKNLADNSIYLENVSFDELTDDEKEAVIKGRKDYGNGDYIDFEDYINQRE